MRWFAVPPPPPPSPSLYLPTGSSAGFSLIEALICVALLALVMALSLGDVRDWLLRQRLANAAQAVLTDLQLARSEALQGGRNVIVRFGEDVDGACYVLHTGALGGCACSPTRPASCEASSQALKQMQWPRRSGQPSVRANVSSMLFSGRKGTVSMGGTLEVRLDELGEVRHIVSITGRVRSCSPDGAISRLPRCT